jgi:hypothetical protein
MFLFFLKNDVAVILFLAAITISNVSYWKVFITQIMLSVTEIDAAQVLSVQTTWGGCILYFGKARYP